MQLKHGARKSPRKLTVGHSVRLHQRRRPRGQTRRPQREEIAMRLLSRRSILTSALLVGLLPSTALFAADQPSTVNIDWATYNPVSIVLKDKGLSLIHISEPT